MSNYPELLPLECLVSDLRDGTHGTHERAEAGVPFLSAKNITDSGHVSWSDEDDKISEKDYQALNSSFALKPDDLLLTIVGSLGRRAIFLGEKVTFQRSVAYIRPRQEKTFPKYLFYAIGHEDFRRSMVRRSNATAQAGLYLGELAKINVGWFPINEQRLIARILDTLDTQIQQTEALIAKLEKVKEGLLHDLLTRGIDENGQLRPGNEQAPELYKESPLGLIPREWEARPLKFHVSSEITYGIVQAGPHIEGGVPYIRTGDMSGDRLERKGLLCTSRQVADQYKRSEVMDGDLVISIRATVGKVLPVPESLSGANLTQGTAKISPSSDADRDYLLWAIRSKAVKNAIDLEVKGSTFKEITLAALREIPVAAPASLIEQRKIGESLAVIDGVIRRESDALMKLKAHKVGLMDDLLTGRVRVTPLLDQAQATTPA